ncbi:MAG: hydrogen peroxide-inducible genes activator [Deltaproteobacteria bacterium]|nr:hydrogen peroxide-inducible genes activator [Deltaproteobacteria bacterium]
MTWLPTVRQLEYVVAVAETGGFGRAAQRTAVSQPALSKQIKEVEAGLGLPLFERGPRGATPTPAGELLVVRARRVLAELQELGDEASALRDPFAGIVRLGAIPTLAPYVLPGLVHAVRAELPRLELRLIEEQTDVLGERLREGSMDLAIVALPYAQKGVRVLGLYEEPFYLVTPPEHPLASGPPVLPADAAKAGPLLLRHGHCLRGHALAACGLAPSADSPLEASSLSTLLLMVEQGLGPTLVPEMALPRETGRVAVRPFAAPVPSRGVGLWWRPSSPRSPLFERLGELLVRFRP